MEFNASVSSPAASFFSIVICVLIIVSMWKIFVKAGEAGWKAIIPFYNLYIEYKLFWGKGWLFILTIIPIVNIVLAIMLYNKMSKSFGHGVGFTIGLLLLPEIFLPILAFNSDEYTGPQ